MLKKTLPFIRILYAIYPFLCVYFTFSAILYEKFGGSLLGVYSVLYGLVVVPQIALNLLSKLFAKKISASKVFCVGDTIQAIAAIAALAIMTALGGWKHDIKYMVPWCLVLVSNLIFLYCFKRNTD